MILFVIQEEIAILSYIESESPFESLSFDVNLWTTTKRDQFPLLLLCKTEFSIQCIFLQNVTMVGTLLGSFDINKKSLWNTHFTRHSFERSEQFSTEKFFLALKLKFKTILGGKFFYKIVLQNHKILRFIQGHPDEMTQKIIICTI